MKGLVFKQKSLSVFLQFLLVVQQRASNVDLACLLIL